ncbi:unnamed protein product [Brassica rapa]|uniref:Uncharacterized protein n=1 Tax=Brassica campestris TaxID=3711 RepID=A0A3P6AYE4_BRACM|nr:unnamed protein product [Brassica rapa]VDC89181.1 unnamed protein product [Brassica rapa]
MMCSVSHSFGFYGLKSYTETSRPPTSCSTRWRFLSDFVLVKYGPMKQTYMIRYVCVIWTCKAAVVYKVYSIAAWMLAEFQESRLVKEIGNLQVGSQEITYRATERPSGGMGYV